MAKRREKYDNIYKELMSIENDDAFLDAVSALPSSISYFLIGTSRYRLGKRVCEIRRERRLKFGTQAERDWQYKLDHIGEEGLDGLENKIKELVDTIPGESQIRNGSQN